MQEIEYFTNTVDNIVKGNVTLTSQITGADYGKYIDYSVTVNGTILDDWRVFYNDTKTGNVYIIYDGYLPNTLIPTATGMTTTGTYQAYWSTDNFTTNTEAVETLTNTSYWSAFAAGVTGATATGTPTNGMFVKSWNNNPAVNSKTLTTETVIGEVADTTGLYIVHDEVVESCYGYWLSSYYSGNTNSIWNIFYSDRVSMDNFNNPNYGIRPVVCLPIETTGSVGSTISIKH